MSIRIQADPSAGTTASQSTRADEMSGISTGSPKSASRGQRTGEDQVEISAFSGTISEANSAQSVHDAGRIQRLAALYRSGSYQVNSLELSRAIVSNALKSGDVNGGA